MKHVFIVNPAAGMRDSTGEISRQIQKLCRELGVDFSIYKTARPGHATELVRQIAREAPEEHYRFYACGGDGTLNEVLNGVVHMENAAFTHYPMGTGNDFIKVFSKEDRARFADLRELILGEEIPVNYIESPELCAVNICSVGIDARVCADTIRYKKICSGQWPYLAAMVENVLRGIGESLEVLADGKRYDGRYSMICLTNGKWYGGGFNPVPEARIDDDRLEMLLVREVSRLKAAAVVGRYKTGRYREMPDMITCLYPREVRIRSKEKPMVVNFDGEIRCINEVTFRLPERRLPLIVPKGARP